MSGNGYRTDPKAIATAGKAFEGQAEPISRQGQKVDQIKGSASTSGRAYGAQGTAYHTALTSKLEGLIREYATKTSWLSGALSQSGEDYTNSDGSGADTLRSAGNGVS